MMAGSLAPAAISVLIESVTMREPSDAPVVIADMPATPSNTPLDNLAEGSKAALNTPAGLLVKTQIILTRLAVPHFADAGALLVFAPARDDAGQEAGQQSARPPASVLRVTIATQKRDGVAGPVSVFLDNTLLSSSNGSDSALARTLRSGEPESLPAGDPARGFLFPDTGDAASTVLLPLREGEADDITNTPPLLGVLALARETSRPAFTREDAVALNVFAGDCAAALDTAVRAERDSLEKDAHYQQRIADQEQALTLAYQEAGRQTTFLRHVLAGLTRDCLQLCLSPSDLPPRLVPYGDPLVLSPRSLRELRRRTQEVAIALGHLPEQWQDLTTGVGEAAVNALVHAGGGTATFHAHPSGTVQIWIEDHGRGGGSAAVMDYLERGAETMPRQGLVQEMGGNGFNMMLKAADRIFLLTTPSGTTVVLEQDRILSPTAPMQQGVIGTATVEENGPVSYTHLTLPTKRIV